MIFFSLYLKFKIHFTVYENEMDTYYIFVLLSTHLAGFDHLFKSGEILISVIRILFKKSKKEILYKK